FSPAYIRSTLNARSSSSTTPAMSPARRAISPRWSRRIRESGSSACFAIAARTAAGDAVGTALRPPGGPKEAQRPDADRSREHAQSWALDEESGIGRQRSEERRV